MAGNARVRRLQRRDRLVAIQLQHIRDPPGSDRALRGQRAVALDSLPINSTLVWRRLQRGDHLNSASLTISTAMFAAALPHSGRRALPESTERPGTTAETGAKELVFRGPTPPSLGGKGSINFWRSRTAGARAEPGGTVEGRTPTVRSRRTSTRPPEPRAKPGSAVVGPVVREGVLPAEPEAPARAERRARSAQPGREVGCSRRRVLGQVEQGAEVAAGVAAVEAATTPSRLTVEAEAARAEVPAVRAVEVASPDSRAGRHSRFWPEAGV